MPLQDRIGYLQAETSPQLLLALVCVALSDWFGTPDHTGWRHPVRNIVAAVGFATVVLLVNQLTAPCATRKGAV